MNEKKRLILICFIVILIFAALVLINTLVGGVRKSPEGTVGALPGNLNNGGLFCERNGIVYFSNAYDSGCLYSMNTDETNVRKLNNAQIKYLNADDNYLYYFQENSGPSSFSFITRVYGLYRSNLKGKNVTCLDQTPVGIIKLINNTLYYQHYDDEDALTFYSIGIDKQNKTQLVEAAVNPASFQDGYIYYNGTKQDHYIHRMNLQTLTSETVYEGNCWFPIAEGEYVYYLDLNNNYRLCRYHLTSQTVEVLVNDRIDLFNIYGDYIYYQKNSPSDPALMRIRTDGSETEVVAAGVYSDINITSQYVYFTSFDSNVPVYKTPTGGPVNVTTFDAAMNAVAENLE